MKKKLRSCNAYVETYETVYVYVDSKCAEVNDAIVLTSYDSVVAIYDKQNEWLYLLPRWEYSVTTLSHISKFCEDYTMIVYRLKDFRNDRAFNITKVDSFGIEEFGYRRRW